MIERITNIEAEPEENLKWLGESFFKEGSLPGGFNLGVFRKTWAGLLSAYNGALWKAMDNGKLIGGMGAIIYPDPNDGALVATEAFWYIAPEHRGSSSGLRMLNEFELWAAMRGAKRLHMAYLLASMPEKVSKLYEKRGYKAREVIYVKEI